MPPFGFRRLAAAALKAATAFSLLISLALGALWVRSYWIQDSLVLPLPACMTLGAMTNWGHLGLTLVRGAFGPRKVLWYHWMMYRGGESALVLGQYPAVVGEWDRNVCRLECFRFHVECFYGAATVSIEQEGVIAWKSASPLPYLDLTASTWLLAALFFVPCAIRIAQRVGRRFARRRRVGQGLCPVCRYDLRGIIERCPECGHPVPAAAKITPT